MMCFALGRALVRLPTTQVRCLAAVQFDGHHADPGEVVSHSVRHDGVALGQRLLNGLVFPNPVGVRLAVRAGRRRPIRAGWPRRRHRARSGRLQLPRLLGVRVLVRLLLAIQVRAGLPVRRRGRVGGRPLLQLVAHRAPPLGPAAGRESKAMTTLMTTVAPPQAEAGGVRSTSALPGMRASGMLVTSRSPASPRRFAAVRVSEANSFP
jgi:hypothetical protein